eukprot:15478368-Alexandrium_andersonii.AAC.1
MPAGSFWPRARHKQRTAQNPDRRIADLGFCVFAVFATSDSLVPRCRLQIRMFARSCAERTP